MGSEAAASRVLAEMRAPLLPWLLGYSLPTVVQLAHTAVAALLWEDGEASNKATCVCREGADWVSTRCSEGATAHIPRGSMRELKIVEQGAKLNTV